MIYIETSRLLLRDWAGADLYAFREMNADEKVMRFFPNTLTYEETNKFYDVIQTEFQQSGYGLYAAEIKDSKEFIGFIGFHRATFEAAFTPCIEIGWRLKKDFWGRGYATEGAASCLKYGFMQLGFNEIYSFTAEINKPSLRVMEKIGMRFAGTFDHPKVDKDSPLCRHVLYHSSSPSFT